MSSGGDQSKRWRMAVLAAIALLFLGVIGGTVLLTNFPGDDTPDTKPINNTTDKPDLNETPPSDNGTDDTNGTDGDDDEDGDGEQKDDVTKIEGNESQVGDEGGGLGISQPDIEDPQQLMPKISVIATSNFTKAFGPNEEPDDENTKENSGT